MSSTFAPLILVVVALVKSIDCDLYEGNRCQLENGYGGICKKLQDCPARMQEVQEGIRTSSSEGRCGFDGFVEIVCCPMNTLAMTRLADVACQQYNSINVSYENPDGVNFVHGGLAAARFEFPFMTALGYENNVTGETTYQCGGSLISMQHVLTAAHCVANIHNKVPAHVLLGTTYLRSTSVSVQKHQIVDIIIHPDFKRSKNYNDVAIVKLKTPIVFSALSRPVCLHTKPVNISSNAYFVVPGWGATDLENDNSEWLLKTPPLSLVSREQCNGPYSGFVKLPNGIDDTMICTLDRDRNRSSDACEGDSGGPLLMYEGHGPYLVGITAFGQICGSYVPGVYTALYPYLDWIERIALTNENEDNIW